MKTKITYVVSDVDYALAFEWIADRLRDDFELSFILIGIKTPKLEGILSSKKIRCTVIADENYPGYFKKFLKVFSLLMKDRPDIVHAHLWRANLIALPVAWLLRIRKRIFTRHHAVIHYTEFPSGRKWDRLINFLATDIVAISANVFNILVRWDKANVKKVSVIPHGFDLKYFENANDERISNLLEKHNLNKSMYPIVGVISRYLEWKGIQFVIPAFERLTRQYPKAHLVLCNTTGNYQNSIKSLLSSLPDKSFTEIPFETDVASLYHIFDVYVHVPINENVEAFGQTYVESLAAGVPSVFSLSGIAKEFIKNGENASVVPFCDSHAIYNSILQILEGEDLSKTLVENGRKSVQQFHLNAMIDKLVFLYQQKGTI